MSGAELVALWTARDARYRHRRAGALTRDEAAAIRAARLAEVDHLPPDQRGWAWRVLQAWTPPGDLR